MFLYSGTIIVKSIMLNKHVQFIIYYRIMFSIIEDQYKNLQNI